MPFELLEPIIATKLQALSETEQHQFRSLHNNFSNQYPLCGIVNTNAFPYGDDPDPKASLMAVYSTMSLINYSCRPNANVSWKADTSRENLHAIRPIPEGEEITIRYLSKAVSSERRAELHKAWGFVCDCPACHASPEETAASDARLLRINKLDDYVSDLKNIRSDPQICLSSCRSLLCFLELEHGDSGCAHYARLYIDAFEICVTHGDRARAAVFTEYAYEALVVCEGEDGSMASKMKEFMEDPGTNPCFAEFSRNWASEKTARPEGLDDVGYQSWLWRQEVED